MIEKVLEGLVTFHYQQCSTISTLSSGDIKYGGFESVCKRITFCGLTIPLSIMLKPSASTVPHADGLGWDVTVALHHSLLGTVMTYSGPVRVVAQAAWNNSPISFAQSVVLDTAEDIYFKRRFSIDTHLSYQQALLSLRKSETIPLSTLTKVIGKHLLVLDGVCVMCDSIASWLSKIDTRNQLLLASNDEIIARSVLEILGNIPKETFDSLKQNTIFVMDPYGNVYIKSDAAIEVLKCIGGRWYVAGTVLSVLPRFVRNSLYNFMGKHRYLIFGKKDVCEVKTTKFRRL